MKDNFARVVEAGMKGLEAAQEKIGEFAKGAEKTVLEAKAKMETLNGLVNSLEDRAFTAYDPILVGELLVPKGLPVDTSYSEITVGSCRAPLGDFFLRSDIERGKPLSGKYRVLVLFQKVE